MPLRPMIGVAHDSLPSQPAPEFLSLFQPTPAPLVAPADPPLPRPIDPQPPASAALHDGTRIRWRCPLSFTLTLVSGLPIFIVGFLAWGIPFLTLTAAIDPLTHSIHTLVLAILQRDLTLTWANMRALTMAQRGLWDVEGQPANAYAAAESLARRMWPLLQANPQLLSVLVTTINDGVVTLVAAHNTNVSTFGPSIGLQNGTHHWVEAWDFQRNVRTGRVLMWQPLLSVDGSFNGFPVNATTPRQPFSWIPVYNPGAIGNFFSANVGLFDPRGQYCGRYSVAMSTAQLRRFLREQLASQPITRGGRLALYDELGLVVAASHGTKDLDRRYALTEIGDPDLESAGRLLEATSGGWCPSTSSEASFSVKYFFDVQLLEDPVAEPQPLRWCAVLLSPRKNTMLRVDQSVSFAVAFVCSMTVGVTALSVALSLLVTRPVRRLTEGMSALKAGHFQEARRATGRKSVFAELFVAQGSYDSLVEAIDAFGKYVPATVVRGLLAGTIPPKLGMAEKDVVLAFMDVENFTLICETNPVEDIVSITCQLFDACCDIVLRSQGTVDKFIGDCVMAMWGAPVPLPCSAVNAVEALIEILHMLRRQPLKCDTGSPVGLLIGAHGGRCLVGNFGATARWDYTAVGDVVNAAARLGPLNKQFGTRCLVSQELYAQATASAWATSCMRPMGDAVVVGKCGPLAVFEVREQPVADREAWALAVQLFGEGDLESAAERFQAFPDDAAAHAFLEDVVQTPPGGPYHRATRGK